MCQRKTFFGQEQALPLFSLTTTARKCVSINLHVIMTEDGDF